MATVYPTPPPTTNTLEPSQRTRLRKSSRKLEAVLGATPIVLEVDVLRASPKASIPRAPITPRTRANRRRGQVFVPTASSSSSSSESEDDDDTVVNISLQTDGNDSDASSFVFVSPSTPVGGYQPHSLPDAVGPASKKPSHRTRSKSDSKLKPKAKPMPSVPVPPLPESVRLDAPLEKKTKKSGPQPLAQPVLLRLRSVPVPPSNSLSSITSSPSVPHSASHQKSSSIATFSSINSNEPSTPRSPFSSVFNAVQEEGSEAKEKEMKRKKMAKLARTLGENVPPELVFPPAKKAERRPTVVRPKRKVSMSRLGPVRKPVGQAQAPSTSTAASPAPKKFKRAHRPRSLSLPLLSPPQTLPIEIEQTNELVDEAPVSPIMFAAPPTAAIPPTPPIVVEARAIAKSAPTKATVPATLSPPRRRPANSMDSPRGRTAFEGLIAAAPIYGSVHTKSNSTNNLLVPHSSGARLQYVPRTTSSLDIDRPPFSNHGHGHAHSASTSATYHMGKTTRSPLDYVYGPAAARAEVDELHRRKEREWSGEWNVQDMGDVVRRLRELKGR